MRKSLTFYYSRFWLPPSLQAFAQDAALVQAARKEGKVVWHTSLALPSSTAIAHYFQNKYKGIEVEVHRQRLPACAAKIHAGNGGGNKRMPTSFIPRMPAILSCSKIKICC